MRRAGMMMVVAVAAAIAGCSDEASTHDATAALDAADSAATEDASADVGADTQLADGVAGDDALDAIDAPGDGGAGDATVAADTAVADTAVADTMVPDTAVADDTVIADTAVADDTAADVPDEVVVPLPGFGTISGECGVLDSELTDPGPSFFVNHLDFADNGWDAATELDQLTAGGQEMWADGNAGGSSVESEIFAFEVLDRCELATLVKSETEVVYDPPSSKKTDILVSIDGLKVGVSVTRAVKFPFDAPYTVDDAKTILTKKLSDILVSSANVVPADKWVKQILHVLAYDGAHVASLETAWNALADDIRADTIVIVTVTDGDDAVIY
ncbi:MAG: hypothetical protein U1F43_07910 [Myxococcota bacterium]